jgi:hypothetical protein
MRKYFYNKNTSINISIILMNGMLIIHNIYVLLVYSHVNQLVKNLASFFEQLIYSKIVNF